MTISEGEKKIYLEKVRQFNRLMAKSIEGPDCIDERVCDGRCCYIHIDVPKFLAEYHVEQGNARMEDFIRGNVFSFQLAVTDDKAKCVFFDENLNGCALHSTEMKPPQCWIYPTGFSNEPGIEKKFDENGKIKCKTADGWWIMDEYAVKQAEKIFKSYVEFCRKEAKFENSEDEVLKRLEHIWDLFRQTPPQTVAGLRDSWDSFKILQAEGMSLRMKKYCNEIKGKEEKRYFKCEHACRSVSSLITERIKERLPQYIEKVGFKRDYTLQELDL